MQLQIECNSSPFKQQLCYLCTHSFESKEAQVIICNDQGTECGEVCPGCIGQGFSWIKNQFEQLNQPQKTPRTHRRKVQEVPISA